MTGLGHPGDTQPGAGSAKLCRLRPRHAGVHRCRLRRGQCTHTQTHAPPAGWDAQTHGCTDGHTEADKGARTHTQSRRQTDGRRGTQAHAQTDAQVHTQTHTQNHKHTDTQTCSHGSLHTCAHAQLPSQVHTPTGECDPDAALGARTRQRRHNEEQKYSQAGARAHTHMRMPAVCAQTSTQRCTHGCTGAGETPRSGPWGRGIPLAELWGWGHWVRTGVTGPLALQSAPTRRAASPPRHPKLPKVQAALALHCRPGAVVAA